MKSGYHKLPAEDAFAIADEVVWEWDVWVEHRKRPTPPAEAPPAPKRKAIEQEVAEEFDDVQEKLATIGKDIKMRRVDFQTIVDSVNRVSLAVRQAQRLSAAASRAFIDEAANLDNIKSGLESILAMSEVEQ